MSKKAFPALHVATVYTGYCMGSGIGAAQDVFDHLYPGIMTLGCAMAQPQAARELAKQIPALAEVPPIDPAKESWRECNRYMSALTSLIGAIVEVDGPVSGATP